LSTALTEDLAAIVADRVATGNYDSDEDVLREALRLLVERGERS
jgi:putative addiction module CopG family antidote